MACMHMRKPWSKDLDLTRRLQPCRKCMLAMSCMLQAHGSPAADGPCWAHALRAELDTASVKCTSLMEWIGGREEQIRCLSEGACMGRLQARFAPLCWLSMHPSTLGHPGNSWPSLSPTLPYPLSSTPWFSLSAASGSSWVPLLRAPAVSDKDKSAAAPSSTSNALRPRATIFIAVWIYISDVQLQYWRRRCALGRLKGEEVGCAQAEEAATAHADAAVQPSINSL